MEPLKSEGVNVISGDIITGAFFNMADPALILEDSGRIVEVNQACTSILKLTRLDLIGYNFFNMLPVSETERKRVSQSFQTAKQTLASFSFKTFLATGEKTGVWVMVNARTFIHLQSTYNICTLTDINQLVGAESEIKAEENKANNLLDNTNDLVQTVSGDGKILSANKKWLDTLGYTHAELVDLHITDIIRENQVPHYFTLLDSVKKGEKLEYIETVFITKDGREIYVEGNINAHFENGQFINTRGIFRDITKRKQVEESYSLLIKNLPIPVYVAKNGVFKFVNAAFSSLMEYSANELVGNPTLDVVHSEDRLRVYKLAISALKAHNPASYEFRVIRKSGEVRWVLETVISIPYEGSEATLGAMIDVTEQKMFEKALDEAKNRFQTIFNNASDAIYIHDLKGHILEVNDAACNLLGYTRTELLKITMDKIVSSRYIDAWNKEKQDLTEKGVLRVESENVTKGGRLIQVEMHSRQIEYERQKVSLVISRDITERKQAKEELEQANQRLRELDKLKDNFLSTVSHEMRTPLASIKSFAEILLNYEEDRPTQKEFLNIIFNESERLTRLINDFLDLSKIQAGRVQWKTERVSLEESIHTAVASAKTLMDKNKLTFSMYIEPALPQVLSDRDRLIQVVTNLLSNATKFTPEGGSIRLEARSEKKGKPDGQVIVSVRDTGIGIALKHHESIFENFGQVGDILKDRPQGTGLGLPICKKIVENYGGKIWVESVLGKGTTFNFSLPAAGLLVVPD